MADELQLLRDLHEKVIRELIKRVESGEAKPQDLAVAVKLLKDNNIDAMPTTGSPISNLTKVLGDELFRGPDDLPN